MTDEIREAEVEGVISPNISEKTLEEKNTRAKRPADAKALAGRDFYVELVLFLILGVLIGIAVKTEASKKITMGFNDYRMKVGVTHYNINQLQADLIEKQSAAVDENSDEGGTCSINK